MILVQYNQIKKANEPSTLKQIFFFLKQKIEFLCSYEGDC